MKKRIIALAAAGALVAGCGSPHTADPPPTADSPPNTPAAAGSMADASAWAIPAGASSTWLELSNISYNGQGGPGEGEGTVGNSIVNGGLSVLPNNARSCNASVTLGT